jgi:hypothetical protein
MLTGLRQAFVPQRLSYRTRGFWRFHNLAPARQRAWTRRRRRDIFPPFTATSLFDEVFFNGRRERFDEEIYQRGQRFLEIYERIQKLVDQD